MFLYQDGKLYIKSENDYLGVSITPKGIIILDKYSTDFIDGQILTKYEVDCRFGLNYEFPTKELGDDIGETGNFKKATRNKRK